MQDQLSGSQSNDLFPNGDLTGVTEIVGQIQQEGGSRNNPENVGGLLEIFLVFYLLKSLIDSLAKFASAIHGGSGQ